MTKGEEGLGMKKRGCLAMTEEGGFVMTKEGRPRNDEKREGLAITRRRRASTAFNFSSTGRIVSIMTQVH